MTRYPVIRSISKLLIPFIFLFGFYVLFHGKVSPGGGFQGGAIWATAYALYGIVFGKELFPENTLRITAATGCLIYSGIGFLCIFMGGNFLDYSTLALSQHNGQFIGIMSVEIGVQLTVFGVLSLLFLKLSE